MRDPETAPQALVSVVIAVLDGERTLAATLASVLAQTHQNLEVVVVDDGSTDATPQIVSGLADERVRLLRQERQGVSASRNRGLREARGEFVAFLDADDLWTARKIEAQLTALLGNPEAAVAYCWTDYIDSDGRRIDRADRVRHEGRVRPALLRRFFLESASNALVRRSALLAVNGFDESHSRAEDWDLYLRLAEAYPFVLVPEVGLLYRKGGASLTADVAATERECLRVVEKAYARSPRPERRLRGQSIAGIYHYLAFQVLGEVPDRRNALRAARYLGRSLTTAPRVAARQPRSTTLLLLKILVYLLLPAPLAKRLVMGRRMRKSAVHGPA